MLWFHNWIKCVFDNYKHTCRNTWRDPYAVEWTQNPVSFLNSRLCLTFFSWLDTKTSSFALNQVGFFFVWFPFFWSRLYCHSLQTRAPKYMTQEAGWKRQNKLYLKEHKKDRQANNHGEQAKLGWRQGCRQRCTNSTRHEVRRETLESYDTKQQKQKKGKSHKSRKKNERRYKR